MANPVLDKYDPFEKTHTISINSIITGFILNGGNTYIFAENITVYSENLKKVFRLMTFHVSNKDLTDINVKKIAISIDDSIFNVDFEKISEKYGIIQNITTINVKYELYYAFLGEELHGKLKSMNNMYVKLYSDNGDILYKLEEIELRNISRYVNHLEKNNLY